MGRAERRREMKKGEKMKKPPVYNYTPESLRGQLKWEANQEFQEKVKKIKAEVYDDAVNAAMMLLLTLPCQVLMELSGRKAVVKISLSFLIWFWIITDAGRMGSLIWENSRKISGRLVGSGWRKM